MADDRHSEDKLWEMIGDIRTTMLTTNSGERLESRPMAAFPDRAGRAIWFITRIDTGKTHDVEANPAVNLGFAAPDDDSYISISGHARVVRDPVKAKELWNPFAEAWMPEGPEAPTTALIRVEPTDATLWDSPSSKLVKLFEVAKANITQTPPKSDEVTHFKM